MHRLGMNSFDEGLPSRCEERRREGTSPSWLAEARLLDSFGQDFDKVPTPILS